MPEEDYSYILEHLQSPERLLDPEFQEWLQQKEHRELFGRLRAGREALIRLKYNTKVQIDEEYRRFERYVQRRRRIAILRRSSVAACILICLATFFFFYNDFVSREAEQTDRAGRKENPGVRLILTEGTELNLDNRILEMKEKNGVWFLCDSSHSLSYRKEEKTKRTDKQEGSLFHTVEVPAGTDYTVNLSDGTRVKLNCVSRLRFPIEFAANERKVFLEGEAFFEVSQATEWPFKVIAGDMEISVTGTRFNVKAYQTEEVAQATLVEGKVAVTDRLTSAPQVILQPAQQYNLNRRTGDTRITDVDTSLYTGWLEGLFVFKDCPVEEIFVTLARWYEIEVIYADPAVKKIRISASLRRSEQVDGVLQILRAMDKMQIERKGNVVLIK